MMPPFIIGLREGELWANNCPVASTKRAAARAIELKARFLFRTAFSYFQKPKLAK
jgi:hypothetical protein